jgi:uncharacterized membrane protein YbaN (DUF454 family)
MSLLGKRARLQLLVLSIILQMIPVTAFWLTRFLLFSRSASRIPTALIALH